jgi:non-canonical purine NTP pyrophosphatase (RdgB/HAM1 family)
MELSDLVFVTSNLGKLEEAEQVLGVKLNHHALDLPEIQSLNIEEVVRAKARAAVDRLGMPVLVEDTSLELAGLGGFPGPLIRWLLSSVGPTGICRIASAFQDRGATARCLACAADGVTEVLGLGVVHGAIAAKPRGRRGFGWDSTFIADDAGNLTYAELSRSAKNKISHRRKALEALRAAMARSSDEV